MAEFDIERSPLLEGVAHGFFGSAGGAHQFGYGGPGSVEDVAALRAAAANTLLPGVRLVAPHQAHSSDVIAVEEPWKDSAAGRPIADAVVTAGEGMALGVVTADCGPVLLADPYARVIGAAHAGWRGSQGGVLENTVAAMERLGARRSDIAAALGPTIAQDSYEVDAPFRQRFGPEAGACFKPAPDRGGVARWLFDLPGYIVSKLESAGVSLIHDCARDTFSNTARYYSYRRAVFAEEPNYGRQIALIAL